MTLFTLFCKATDDMRNLFCFVNQHLCVSIGSVHFFVSKFIFLMAPSKLHCCWYRWEWSTKVRSCRTIWGPIVANDPSLLIKKIKFYGRFEIVVRAFVTTHGRWRAKLEGGLELTFPYNLPEHNSSQVASSSNRRHNWFHSIDSTEYLHNRVWSLM